jgi:signal transduction histidine kinase
VRRPATLRNRLALVAVASTAVWITVLTVVFNVLLTSRLRSQSVALAKDRAEAIASVVEVVGGVVTEHESQNDIGLDSGVWIFNGTTVYERPRVSEALQSAAAALVGMGRVSVRPAADPHVQLYAFPLMSDGRQAGTVVTSVSLQPYERALQLALFGSLGIAVAVLAGVYTGARLLVARALRPVEQMTRQAAAWSADDVDRRFSAVSRHRELAVLATTLDGMLDRISAALRHEKRLSGELSHELRTPLTHILAETELLSDARADEQTSASYARISRSAERMQAILTTLLSAARAESGAAPGRCDVAEALRACVEDWSGADPQLHVDLDESVRAGVPAQVVERIVQPLIDNAKRHARAAVRVGATTGPGGPIVTIDDDGPGVAPELVETVFEPGYTTGGAHGGAGLGLALSRRLARAAGGDVRCVASPAGGSFRVFLPGG